jgi:hypothetical protein
MNWNAAHTHLALIHLPIAGALFAVIFLLLAEAFGARWLWRAGAILLLLAAAGAAGAYFTGEGAEDVLGDNANKNEAAFSNATEWVRRHEDMGQWAFFAALAAGAGGLLLLFFAKGNEGGRPPAAVRLGVLALAIGSSVLVVLTANMGGDVRHSEIRATEKPPGKIAEEHK